jgi:hypothetical protein
MATVDPYDDDIKRYVVQRYAYDSEHHQRRYQVVAAFDNEREFIALIHAQKRISGELKGGLAPRGRTGPSVAPF